MPKPICFMIMPYGKKPTQAEAGRGVPEIDFNALWDRAFAPTIVALGYEPVRADQDTGALIITQMIERLYFADLVLADMTIPNGNVYYEIGVRHAAKEKGCVLLAADWSKQLFDVAQMRTIRYPLVEGNIEPPTAQAIAVRHPSADRGPWRGADRPCSNSIKGYPSHVEPGAASTMKGRDGRIRRLPGRNPRRARPAPRRPDEPRQGARGELMQASRHCDDRARGACGCSRIPPTMAEDWNWITDFTAKLPADIADLEEVRETHAFALANAGQPVRGDRKARGPD